MPYKDPEIQKLYDKQKYQRNRERILALRRQRHAENREEENARISEYQKRNRKKRNEYHRNWRKRKQTDQQKNAERETAKRWRKANTQRVLATVTRYQLKHPWKAVAHAAVNMAVKVKLLVRPNCCSSCGKSCKPHAHHPDYSKILEVIWLCAMCHKQAHLSPSYAKIETSV